MFYKIPARFPKPCRFDLIDTYKVLETLQDKITTQCKKENY